MGLVLACSGVAEAFDREARLKPSLKKKMWRTFTTD